MVRSHTGGDQIAVIELLIAQFGGDAAILHHQHTIAQTEQFVVVAAVKHNRRALLLEFFQQALKLHFRAHINPFGRVVKQ